jgi:hypothetical protein
MLAKAQFLGPPWGSLPLSVLREYWPNSRKLHDPVSASLQHVLLFHPHNKKTTGVVVMAVVRASHLRLVINEPAPVAERAPRLRFKPVVRLADGASHGLQVETDTKFEDTFRPRHLSDAQLPSAAAWLGDLIERAGRLAQDTDFRQRPIVIPAPMAALADPDCAMACEAGALRAGMLPQEFRIDFCDASVSNLEDMAMDRLDAVRKRGFRVGLDARKTWRTPMNARARMTFEAVRLDPFSLDAQDIPVSRLEVASADGVALVADNAHWRDADKLAESGINYALSPKIDS